MSEQSLTGSPVLSSELGTFPFEGAIPAPRSGRSYDMWLAEVCDGRHGCLDADVD